MGSDPPVLSGAEGGRLKGIFRTSGHVESRYLYPDEGEASAGRDVTAFWSSLPIRVWPEPTTRTVLKEARPPDAGASADQALCGGGVRTAVFPAPSRCPSSAAFSIPPEPHYAARPGDHRGTARSVRQGRIAENLCHLYGHENLGRRRTSPPRASCPSIVRRSLRPPDEKRIAEPFSFSVRDAGIGKYRTQLCVRASFTAP